MNLVPFEYEAGWVPEPFWKFWREKKIPARISKPDRPARCLIRNVLYY